MVSAMDEERSQRMEENTLSKEVRIEDVENLLGRLEGIERIRLVVNNWGAIEEVHVLSRGDRRPKDIVRDVESALAARFGLIIDHKKISVAQLRNQAQERFAARVRIKNYQVVNYPGQNKIRIEVVLYLGDDEIKGSSEGIRSKGQIFQVAARATVDALNHMIQEEYQFLFQGLETTSVSGQPIAVAVLSLASQLTTHNALVGSAMLEEDDPVLGSIRAVLAAVNRRLEAVPKVAQTALEVETIDE